MVGPEEVEFVITDNGVLYAGEAVPNCLRITADRVISVINNAEGDATVTFGATSIDVFDGDRADSETVSTYAPPGGSFEVSVVELSTTVTMQVRPA